MFKSFLIKYIKWPDNSVVFIYLAVIVRIFSISINSVLLCYLFLDNSIMLYPLLLEELGSA